MIFTNHRSYVPSTKSINYTSTHRMAWSAPRVAHRPSNVQLAVPKTYAQKAVVKHESKKIRWGEPFWNLFHMMAEKVKESEFPKIRVELLNLIYTICTNLPCPDCTQHATHYLNGINFNAIHTKEQLKTMLYEFHNAVNARKGYPLFPRDQLDEKYQYSRVVPIMETFLFFYRQKHHSVRLMADDLHRQRMAKNFTEWFQANLHCFQ